MGKKRKTNISGRVKTSHKKSLIKRKIVNQKVNPGIKNINKFVSDSINHKKDADPNPQQNQIDAEAMSMADFQKLMKG